MRKTLGLVATVAATLMLTAASTKAEEYPSRAITVIVPYSAGGGGDVVARIAAEALERLLGKPLIVENVTGAGGVTGIRRAANAAPDGYTMATAAPGTHSAAPALFANLGYEPIDSFEIVGLTGSSPIVLVTRKGLPVKDLKEFAAYVKANEKTITLAHVGPGSMTHLACSMLDSIMGVSPTAVAYRGTPPLMQDMLGGRVDYTCQQPNGVMGLVESGDVTAIAVADTHRTPSMPNVPTAAEQGFPAFKSTAWNGLVMPKGTPAAIVDKVNAALAKALSDPVVVERLAKVGVSVPAPEERSREYARKLMKEELERYTTLMQSIGIKPK